MFTRSRSAFVCAAAVCLFTIVTPRSALAQTVTIPLNLSLDNLVTVNATLTVDAAAIQAGQLVVSATASGSVTLNGTTAIIAAQPFTVTASTTCKAGTGTLTLTTTTLNATLPGGITATVAPETVTVSVSCGRSPTLNATVSPVSASLSDGTSISTSQISASISARANTALGSAICTGENVVCSLNTAIAGGLVSTALDLLNQVLSTLPVAAI
jgi:YbbR domain-containing protein